MARARCSALLTDATVVPSSSAVSAALHCRTSRKMSTARWRAGRCCSAATNASRIVSLATARSAGSPSIGTTIASGTGCSQVSSPMGSPSDDGSGVLAEPKSIGRARLPRLSSIVRHTLVAMR